MKPSKQNRQYLLDFLIKSNSLYDLLGILASICENLDLAYLNPRIKHFRYFQLTFFGLMVKAKGLLEMMAFRAEFLKNSHGGFAEIYEGLIRLKTNMDSAYCLVNKNKMLEGKNRIIALNKEYAELFESINKRLGGVV